MPSSEPLLPAQNPPPPAASQIAWPAGFTPLPAASTPAADPSPQQQQQASGSSAGQDSQEEDSRSKNPASPKKSRPIISLDWLLPPGSPFATVAVQPHTSTPSAAAAALPTALTPPPSSPPQEVMVTISREGHPPVSAPGPPGCAVQEVITRWASYAGLPVDALEVAHKGCPLDRQTWDLSFMQLGFGPAETQLDVKVNHALAGPSTPTPDPNTPAHDPHASGSSQAGTQSPPAAAAGQPTVSAATVRVTVHMEGKGAVAGNGPADFKLGDLLAHATGLPVDALQVRDVWWTEPSGVVALLSFSGVLMSSSASEPSRTHWQPPPRLSLTPLPDPHPLAPSILAHQSTVAAVPNPLDQGKYSPCCTFVLWCLSSVSPTSTLS